MTLEKRTPFPPHPDISWQNPIPHIHTMSDSIAVCSLSLEDYGNENLFSYVYTDTKSDVCAQFDQSSGIDLHVFESPHRHDYFEILLVLEGELNIVIEGSRTHYGYGDLCLLNRNTRHHEEFRGNFKICYFFLSGQFIKAFLTSSAGKSASPNIQRFFRRNLDDTITRSKDYIDFHLLDKDCQKPQTFEIWEQIRAELVEKQPGYELFINGWLCRLFALLENKKQHQSESGNLKLLSEKELTDEIIFYLHAQKKRITRQEVAEALSYNGDYLNRVFKKQTGKSILEYNQNICMKEAARLLSSSSSAIETIAKVLGYENRTNFYKLFQKMFGMTPGEYRMHHPMSM